MTTYDTWGEIPNGVTVYVPSHCLLAIKLESATLVGITEYEGKAGWMQTTGRLKGPFQDVYGGLVASKVLSVNDVRQLERQPRQWADIQQVPAGVRVRDEDGDLWKFRRGQWYFKTPRGRWLSWGWDKPACGLYTEIVK